MAYMSPATKRSEPFLAFMDECKTILDKEKGPGWCDNMRLAKLQKICFDRWVKLSPEIKKSYGPSSATIHDKPELNHGKKPNRHAPKGKAVTVPKPSKLLEPATKGKKGVRVAVATAEDVIKDIEDIESGPIHNDPAKPSEVDDELSAAADSLNIVENADRKTGQKKINKANNRSKAKLPSAENGKKPVSKVKNASKSQLTQIDSGPNEPEIEVSGGLNATFTKEEETAFDKEGATIERSQDSVPKSKKGRKARQPKVTDVNVAQSGEVAKDDESADPGIEASSMKGETTSKAIEKTQDPETNDADEVAKAKGKKGRAKAGPVQQSTASDAKAGEQEVKNTKRGPKKNLESGNVSTKTGTKATKVSKSGLKRGAAAIAIEE